MADGKPEPIPGFAINGRRYRAPVSLERADAEEVSAEAQRRGVPVSRVLEERVTRAIRTGSTS